MLEVYHCLLGLKIYDLIPSISKVIEAEDQSENFIKAHDKFYSNDDLDSEFWILKGKKGSISVQFEKHEMYLHFHVFIETKNQKKEVESLINKPKF